MKDIIIFGASGMVGDLMIRKALCHNEIRKVTIVTRSSHLSYSSPWLNEMVIEDFQDISLPKMTSEKYDVCFYCAGVYSGAVNKSDYEKSTTEPLLKVSKMLKEHSPDLIFNYLSEWNPTWLPTPLTPSHLRIRKKMEEMLIELAFFRLHIFRPSYIYPSEPRTEPTLTSKLKRRVFKVAKHGVTSYSLVDAMLYNSLNQSDQIYFDNAHIRKDEVS